MHFAWYSAIVSQRSALNEVVALKPRSRCWHCFTTPSLSNLWCITPAHTFARMVCRQRRMYSSSTLPLDRAWVPEYSRREYESEHPLTCHAPGPVVLESFT